MPPLNLPEKLQTAPAMTRLLLLLEYPREEIVQTIASYYKMPEADAEDIVAQMQAEKPSL